MRADARDQLSSPEIWRSLPDLLFSRDFTRRLLRPSLRRFWYAFWRFVSFFMPVSL